MSQVRNREQAAARRTITLSATAQRKTEIYVLVRDEGGLKHLPEDCARLLRFQNENGSCRFDLPSSFCFLIGVSKDRIDNLLSLSFRGFIGWRC
jgi:hypothetical protein